MLKSGGKEESVSSSFVRFKDARLGFVTFFIYRDIEFEWNI